MLMMVALLLSGYQALILCLIAPDHSSDLYSSSLVNLPILWTEEPVPVVGDRSFSRSHLSELSLRLFYSGIRFSKVSFGFFITDHIKDGKAAQAAFSRRSYKADKVPEYDTRS